MQLFQGGGAKREAERSRRLQEVSNDRQLAELNRGEGRAGLVRRNPRGRRLFSDAGQNGLQSNLA